MQAPGNVNTVDSRPPVPGDSPEGGPRPASQRRRARLALAALCVIVLGGAILLTARIGMASAEPHSSAAIGAINRVGTRQAGRYLSRPDRDFADSGAPPTAGRATAASPVAPATQYIIYEPWTASGVLAPSIRVAATTQSSNCVTAESSDRPDAFRCFTADTIYDPCFSNPDPGSVEQLACTYPGNHDVTVIDYSGSHPPDGTAPPPGPLRVWLLYLAGDVQCSYATGATSVVAGMRLNYTCSNGLDLYGSPDRTSSTWTIYAQYTGSSALSAVAISTAYS